MVALDILAVRVAQFRRELGLSQEAFADKCGLDRTYISGIERGVRNPTVKVLEKLAEGLERQTYELLEPIQK